MTERIRRAARAALHRRRAARKVAAQSRNYAAALVLAVVAAMAAAVCAVGAIRTGQPAEDPVRFIAAPPLPVAIRAAGHLVAPAVEEWSLTVDWMKLAVCLVV